VVKKNDRLARLHHDDPQTEKTKETVVDERDQKGRGRAVCCYIPFPVGTYISGSHPYCHYYSCDAPNSITYTHHYYSPPATASPNTGDTKRLYVPHPPRLLVYGN